MSDSKFILFARRVRQMETEQEAITFSESFMHRAVYETLLNWYSLTLFVPPPDEETPPAVTPAENDYVPNATELEMLQLLHDGLSYKKIAEKKNEGFFAVRERCRRLRKKLGVGNKKQLLALAVKKGWVKPKL